MKNIKSAGDKHPSPWKICVMPNSTKEANTKGRRVLDFHRQGLLNCSNQIYL